MVSCVGTEMQLTFPEEIGLWFLIILWDKAVKGFKV